MTVKTDRIVSIDDLLEYFPSPKHVANEYHTACPFCSTGNVHSFRGNEFYGEDRFVLKKEGRGGFCRRCSLEGNGDRNTGWWSIQSIGKKLGLIITQEFRSSLRDLPVEEEPLRMLWYQGQVTIAHKKVNRDFWKKFGWTDETINFFQLGMGTLYSRNPDMNIIPIKVTHIGDTQPMDMYYISTRGTNAEGVPVKERSMGTISPYAWLIREDSASRTIAVVEGEKDMITAYQLGYRNLICSFGVNHFNSKKVQWLKSLGYDRLVDLIDADEPGRALANRAAAWATQAGMQWVQNTWEGTKPEDAKDLTDLLQALSDKGTKAFLAESLILRSPEAINRNPIRSNLILDMEADAASADIIVDVEELRGMGPNSMRTHAEVFLQEYEGERKRGVGKVLLLSIPPGAGKTHAMIQLVEDLVAKELPRKEAEYDGLVKSMAQLEENMKLTASLPEEDKEALKNAHTKLKERIDNFSFELVSWFGQYKEGFQDLLAAGARKDWWFNYEARNESNCANLSLVSELGKNNHDVGSFCRFACPFREACKEKAFLNQDRQRHRYPITFLRHQHLLSPQLVTDRKLLVIDEYAGNVFEGSPVVFNISDVQPFREGWELDMQDQEKIQFVRMFTEAVRSAMSYNLGAVRAEVENTGVETTLSGANVLRLIDQHLRSNDSSLAEVTTEISSEFLHKHYQPTFNQMGGREQIEVQNRCVPFLFDTILREMPDYQDSPENKFPSCINLVQGRMEVYASKSIDIPSKIPVIILDATAFPALYQAMFKREVAIRKYSFRNPNASTTVYVGSDYTHGYLNSSLGQFLRNRKSKVRMTAKTIEGNTFNAEDVEFDMSIGQNSLVQDCHQMVSHLVGKHGNLLVVTHKVLREVLEFYMTRTYPDLQKVDDKGRKRLVFGHYGALRGTNAYKDYDAVLLIGAFRVPYEVLWRRIQMWTWLLGLRSEIPITTIIRTGKYHTQTIGHGFRSFENEFAAEYVDMVEAGEMQQCAERIRPHSDKKQKFVYIMASRPALRFVDAVYDKRETIKQLLSQGDIEIRTYIDTYRRRNNNRQPSMRMLSKEFRMSLRDIQKIVKKYRCELQTDTGENEEGVVD